MPIDQLFVANDPLPTTTIITASAAALDPSPPRSPSPGIPEFPVAAVAASVAFTFICLYHGSSRCRSRRLALYRQLPRPWRPHSMRDCRHLLPPLRIMPLR